MRGTTKFGLAVVLLVAFCQTASLLADTTYYVNADCGDDAWSGLSPDCVPEDGPKRTIVDAIQAAVSGDTILVAPGTYRENLRYRGKNIIITSTDGPEVTIIDGGGRNASVVLLVRGGEPRRGDRRIFAHQRPRHGQRNGAVRRRGFLQGLLGDDQQQHHARQHGQFRRGGRCRRQRAADRRQRHLQ